jgi:hypothetical protein
VDDVQPVVAHVASLTILTLGEHPTGPKLRPAIVTVVRLEVTALAFWKPDRIGESYEKTPRPVPSDANAYALPDRC